MPCMVSCLGHRLLDSFLLFCREQGGRETADAEARWPAWPFSRRFSLPSWESQPPHFRVESECPQREVFGPDLWRAHRRTTFWVGLGGPGGGGANRGSELSSPLFQSVPSSCPVVNAPSFTAWGAVLVAFFVLLSY